MIGFSRLRDAMVRRARQARRDDDDGYILVYVLVVSMLILGMVSTVAVSATNNVVPAQSSAYSMSATAAAQSGIQAYYARLLADKTCTSPIDLHNSTVCDPTLADPQGSPDEWTHQAIAPGPGAPAFTSANQPYYSVEVLAVTPQFVRVRSTGEIGQRGEGLHTVKTLVADIAGSNTSFLDYAYYSTYETVGLDDLRRQYDSVSATGADTGPTIGFDSQDQLRAAGVTDTSVFPVVNADPAKTAPTQITWDPVPATDGSGLVGAQWCDRLYYNTTAGDGTTLPGRWQNATTLPAGYNWQRQVATGSALAGTTQNGVCQVAFTTGTSIDGPLYTRDAPMLSYGTSGGNGPDFGGPAYTAWSLNDSPAAGPPYLTFPVIGGSTAGGANLPTTAGWDLSMPTWSTVASQVQTLAANPAINLEVCEYWGPTRVYVKDAYAYVTSPLTAAGADHSPCYASTGTSGVTVPDVPSYAPRSVTPADGTPRPNTGPSVYQAQVPVAYTLILVHDATTTTQTAPETNGCARQLFAANTVLCTNGTANAGDLLGAPVQATTTTASVTDLDHLPNKSTLAGAVVNGDGTLKGTATSSLLDDLTDQLGAAFQQTQGETLYPNRAAATATAPTSGSDNTYYVTYTPSTEPSAATDTTDCPATTTPEADSRLTAPTPSDGDPLLMQQSQGTSRVVYSCTAKSVTATITRVGASQSCVLFFCGKAHWESPGDDATAAKVSAGRESVTATTEVVTPAASRFPLKDDVTQYRGVQSGPGDAYVEGNVTGKLSVVADHDIVLTGSLDGQNATSLVARNDVRIYHPVSCLDTLAAATAITSPGFCPNDTTGLSTPGKLWFGNGNFDKHPSRQYVNMLGPQLRNLTINAAVFAVDGSLTADNYNRGDACGWPYAQNGTSITTSAASACGAGTGAAFGLQSDGLLQLTVSGGVYQEHHGGVGAQWPVAPTGGQRPSSGYRLGVDYQSAMRTAGIPYVPTAVGGNGNKPWQIAGVATASSGGTS